MSYVPQGRRTFDAPRLQYPLRLSAAGARMVEQDTVDDLVSTAFFALRTPPGWRPEAPGFGVPDPAFELAATDTIVAALADSDPRLAVMAEADRDEFTLRIRLLIGRTDT